MNFDVGTQVTSAVRLVRPLGQGGMGAVWVAEHQTLRTDVVVKFMSDALASDPVSLARFSLEASAAAAVKSPHVVQMLDHGFTEDGTPFIVMELLDGEDLRRRLARDHVVPLAELGVIIRQACKALTRAHASGIVHRDIKPDNIFLCRTDDGEPFVKLLDFGIAKAGGPAGFHMTHTGAMVGTPFYMSPEQAVGSPPVDSTTDLWSLGVVAFEAMTGARPFDGPTIGALTIAICEEKPPVPSLLNPKVPTAIDAWVARACARDRSQRFASARAMADTLAAVLREPSAPLAVPLAFEATSPSARPAARSEPAPAMATSATARSLPIETASGLATTTTPLSRTGAAGPDRSAPLVHAPRPSIQPLSTSRGPYLLAGAMLLALGVAGGFGLAERDVAPRPASSQSAPESVLTAPLGAAGGVAPVLSTSVAEAPLLPAPSAVIVDKPVLVHGAPSPSSRATAALSVASARPHPSASAALPPRTVTVSCDPPYFFDAANNKVFKRECL